MPIVSCHLLFVGNLRARESHVALITNGHLELAVRDNFGIANAVLKGRNSTLEVDYLYTKKPRRSIDDYVVLLQSNIRIMIARRTVLAYAYMREQQEKRGEF